MLFSPLIDKLITALRYLPGIGPKSAQRMAFHLLQSDRAPAMALAQVIEEAAQKIHHCQRCRTFSETSLCLICTDNHRDKDLLCIVETATDALAIEQTGSYRGLYFILRGRLSPLDGIGPKELGIEDLSDLLAEHRPKEVVLATNSTVEGEATAHYLAELVKQQGIRTTRIAYGMPLGGELSYIDLNTITRALAARTHL